MATPTVMSTMSNLPEVFTQIIKKEDIIALKELLDNNDVTNSIIPNPTKTAIHHYIYLCVVTSMLKPSY
jgi:hypothetical protein